jgi:two-component system phosphate regulon sensor histidine kinase PhoR
MNAKSAVWHELRLLGAVIAAFALLGWAFGGMMYWLALPLIGYIGWSIWNGARLLQAVRMDSELEEPDFPGIWQSLFSQLTLRRQQQREQLDKLRRLISKQELTAHALPDSIVMLDARFGIEWCNRSASELLGIRMDTDLGQHIDNLIRHPDFFRHRNEQSLGSFINMPAPANNEKTLGVALFEHGNEGYVLVARDITDRQRIDQIRRDFVSNVSHELRTPITVLGGYLETMVDAQGQIPKRWTRPIEAMNSQVRRMTNLVEDLLLLSRIESVDQPHEEVSIDVELMLEQIVSEAAVLSGESHHIIELDAEPIKLFGAETEIRTAFVNLVANAVQHTPAGGRISVRWFRKDDALHFEVTDSGEGISPEHLPRLTERFYRVDSGRSRDLGGTGLGLAIVKHILQHYHGELDIESELGVGSRFSCRFPARLAVDPGQASSAA